MRIEYIGEDPSPLVAAAREGDAGVMRALLTDGCGDIDACKGHIGHTAVHAACLKRHVDILRLLLEAGADWSIASSDGSTPLDVVREKGFATCMEVLEVSRGAALFLDALHVLADRGFALGLATSLRTSCMV
jgi:ankyrin repeat protein